MLTDNEARKLADAIQSWLDFQILCKRTPLLSEAYLAQPIGEFLRSYHSGEIESEWNHPRIPSPQQGRPRQVDYVLFSRDKGRAVSAIEAKWVTDRKASRQRLLNDILRLERLRSKDENPMGRYFLIAGESDHIKEYCFDLQYNTDNGGRKKFLEQLLPFDDTEKHVPIREYSDGITRFFREFEQSYKVPVPTSYKAERIADKDDDKARVVIWKIKSVRGRSEFHPTRYWTNGAVTQ